MPRLKLKALALVAILAVAPAAVAQMAMGPAMTGDTSLGTVLVGPDGMTLYIFDRDEPGVTNCYEQCAVNWPPFFVTEDAAMADENWTIVDRTDGTQMWAYMGQPLYYWINDGAPGDVTGDGVGDVWHVVVVGEAM